MNQNKQNELFYDDGFELVAEKSKRKHSRDRDGARAQMSFSMAFLVSDGNQDSMFEENDMEAA